MDWVMGMDLSVMGSDMRWKECWDEVFLGMT